MFVAWAGLPFAIRDVVRTVYIVSTRQLIISPDIGFFHRRLGGLDRLSGGILHVIDIYMIWN